MFASGSIINPITPLDYATASNNALGRTPRPSRLTPGERTAIILGVGQSVIAASENANYTPVNSGKVDNLNVFDGGIYAASDPLLGTGVFSSGGCWLSRQADKMITSGNCDRVIIVPIARGSSTVQDWAPGGILFPSLIAAHRRLAALGLVATATQWVQGQANIGISQADYQAALQSVITGIRSYGFVSPWLIGKDTYNGATSNANIRNALTAVINGSDILAGADTDSLTAVNRYDGVHFSATGADAAATLWRTAYLAAGLI